MRFEKSSVSESDKYMLGVIALVSICCQVREVFQAEELIDISEIV